MNHSRQIDEQLAHLELFHGLSRRQVRKVSGLTSRIDVQPGTVLTREDKPGAEFIIVLDGEVEVRKGDRLVATRGPGDFLGEISLLGGRNQTATAVAKTPVVISVMSKREFWSMFDQVPALSDKVRTTMTSRLTHLSAADEGASLAA